MEVLFESMEEQPKPLNKEGALLVSTLHELGSFRLNLPVSVFAKGNVLSLWSLLSRRLLIQDLVCVLFCPCVTHPLISFLSSEGHQDLLWESRQEVPWLLASALTYPPWQFRLIKNTHALRVICTEPPKGIVVVASIMIQWRKKENSAQPLPSILDTKVAHLNH